MALNIIIEYAEENNDRITIFPEIIREELVRIVDLKTNNDKQRNIKQNKL